MTIQLAANFSGQLIELIEDGLVDFLDYIKVPLVSPPQGQVKVARAYRRALLHCWGKESIWLGAAKPSEVFQPLLLDELIRLSDTPYISTHLELRFPDLEAIGGFDCEDPFDLVYSHMLDNTRRLKESLPLDLVLENGDYFRGREATPVTMNPRFLRDFLEEVDCGFLLDIGHARVSAWHLGYSFEDYLNQLPLERVVEMHVHSPAVIAGIGLMDEHLALGERDYELIQRLIRQTPVQVISLEYGGAKEGLSDPRRNSRDLLYRQLARVQELITAV